MFVPEISYQAKRYYIDQPEIKYYPAGKIYGELEEGYTLPPYISDYDKK